MLGLQPSERTREMSSSFCGVPSGLLRSYTMFAWLPTGSRTATASSRIVRSSAPPTFTGGGAPRAKARAPLGGTLDEMDARLRHVVGVQEFPPRRAGSPHRDRAVVPQLRLVELADQRRKNMARLQIVVVARPVEVGRHGAEVARAVLAVVGPAHLDPRDLCDRVGTVGGVERGGEKVLLLDRLRTVARINARGAQKKELAHAGAKGFVDHVGLDGQVLVDELRRVGVVREDPADFGGGEQDDLGLLAAEEFAHGGAVREVELGVGAGNEAAVALRAQAPH